MLSTAPYRAKPISAVILLFMLFIAVCLPTGSIFGFNVKVALFAALFVVFVFDLLTNSDMYLTSAESAFLISFAGALCFWSLIAVLNGESDTVQLLLQLKDLASTILIAWMSIFFIRRGVLRPERVIAAVVYGAIALALMKLALVAAMFRSGLDPVLVFESVFGEGAIVGGSIALGLVRLEFPSDIMGSLALFAIVCPSVSGIRLRKTLAVPFIFLLVTSGVLAYGRYIWMLEVFAIIAAMVIEKRFRLLVAMVIGVVLAAYLFSETLHPLFEARFFSEQTTESDVIRLEQSRALVEAIEDRPLFGKGVGTHVNGLIRSEQNKYSYELQWMSLLMQFGTIGIVGILLLVVASVNDLFAARDPSKPWLASFFALWLLSGWTNPHLLSSFAGATFGMFMAMFYKIRYRTLSREAT